MTEAFPHWNHGLGLGVGAVNNKKNKGDEQISSPYAGETSLI